MCDATTAVVSALFSIVLFMSRFTDLITSKKFWTLVAAIVAALAAFFTVGCAAQARVQRQGIHTDTVRVNYIIRSRSFTTP